MQCAAFILWCPCGSSKKKLVATTGATSVFAVDIFVSRGFLRPFPLKVPLHRYSWNIYFDLIQSCVVSWPDVIETVPTLAIPHVSKWNFVWNFYSVGVAYCEEKHIFLLFFLSNPGSSFFSLVRRKKFWWCCLRFTIATICMSFPDRGTWSGRVFLNSLGNLLFE